MFEVILDTETTGLSISEKHRIVEIGCIELKDQIPTNKIFHYYLNPERSISEEAYKVHGYSEEFLSDKKTFAEISDIFLNFIKGRKLIIHNAQFDLSFLNYELSKNNKEKIDKKNVVDTLEIARQKFPGSQNSLDALCKRFGIDKTRRKKHSALVDCELLKEVYINLIDQKEPKLNLESSDILDIENSINENRKSKVLRKIIQPSIEELKNHKDFLKQHLKKNYYT